MIRHKISISLLFLISMGSFNSFADEVNDKLGKIITLATFNKQNLAYLGELPKPMNEDIQTDAVVYVNPTLTRWIVVKNHFGILGKKMGDILELGGKDEVRYFYLNIEGKNFFFLTKGFSKKELQPLQDSIKAHRFQAKTHSSIKNSSWFSALVPTAFAESCTMVPPNAAPPPSPH